MLCLSRKECEELCIAEPDCVGFDMHKTLDRCWLNVGSAAALEADEDYHHVAMRTCNGKDFWWDAFDETAAGHDYQDHHKPFSLRKSNADAGSARWFGRTHGGSDRRRGLRGWWRVGAGRTAFTTESAP